MRIHEVRQKHHLEVQLAVGIKCTFNSYTLQILWSDQSRKPATAAWLPGPGEICTHHMKAVADVLVALEGADAVTHLHKGAGVLQQAHDLSLWQLSVWLVCKGQKQHIKNGNLAVLYKSTSCNTPYLAFRKGSFIHLSFCLSVVCERTCVLCGSYQACQVGTNRQLSLRLQAVK